MRKYIIISCVIMLLFFSSAIVGMYSKGIIYSQDHVSAYNNVIVEINTVQDEKKQYTILGFFITKNKVALCGYPELIGRELTVTDINDNKYNVIDQKVYEHLIILETEKPNKNDVKYLYGFVNDNDLVRTCINGEPKICKYKVIENKCDLGSLTAILCEGDVEGNASTPAFDEHGRIIGLTTRSTDENKFYVYPFYEIISKIVADDIFDFLGIE